MRIKNILPLFLALPFSVHAQEDIYLSWASKDVHYASNASPARAATTDTSVTAWRGERAGMQALIHAPEATGPLKVRLTEWRQGTRRVRAGQGTARFVSYVTTNNYQACGYPDTERLTAYKVPDIIETDRAVRMEAGETRPVWCALEVPRDARPGVYKTRLELADSATGRVLKKISLSIHVREHTLPTPAAQTFHVDFWQQPYAVSRYYGVPRWSDEHFELLRPYLELLARSGQKVVSAVLFYEPWGEQSLDKFDPMVRVTKKNDGTWEYDYTVFDRWVELCASCGIDKSINCFSMVPWDMAFSYFDEAQRREVQLKTTTGSKEYEELWTAFLQSFALHLKGKGWYEKTSIAMDERGLSNMLDAYRVAQKAVPGIRMALAGSYHKELVDKLADYCIGWGERFTGEELASRRARGWVSTSYTCCSTPSPNIFSNSLPAEAACLPLYCAANRLDGYLHWSWMNWTQQPLADTRYRMFAPGDTYLIYPGPRSSVRYERFMEGVAQAEKVRILRGELERKGDQAALSRLNAMLRNFEAPVAEDPTKIAQKVNEMERLLNECDF